MGQSPSWLVNASTWGLMLTGYVVDEQFDNKPAALFKHLITRLGEPVIRTAILQAMKLMGRQFVLGRTLEDAFKHSRSDSSYTFDMLGEAALTQADAERFIIMLLLPWGNVQRIALVSLLNYRHCIRAMSVPSGSEFSKNWETSC
ncbi:hypothetical protein PN36_31805 [Candidatus Thiomargarita nelsonii]|uniref:Proline dehydrogenase PutA domain-containing protein n=1 Tax=Candidatus Thiomargarita nelsonii TaxID=1003181 RepID=A0A4E0QVQ2_9GAMM|nr:hypothetical protein PN36_31805 [Candidatus Thiomargarita nelsonii]